MKQPFDLFGEVEIALWLLVSGGVAVMLMFGTLFWPRRARRPAVSGHRGGSWL